MTPRVLLAAGSNGNGQLGIGSHDDSAVFAPVPLPPSALAVKQIAAGANYTLLLTEEHELYLSGRDRAGDLARLGATAAGSDEITFRRADLSRLPAEVVAAVADYHLEEVACAWETSFLHFRRAGHSRLVSFGANDWGERGCGMGSLAWATLVDLGEETEEVCEITTGVSHVIARVRRGNNDSLLLGWGGSRAGQLGRHGDEQGQSLASVPTPTELRLPASLPAPNLARDTVLILAGLDYTAILDTESRLHILTTRNKTAVEGGRTIDLASDRCCQPSGTWRHVFVAAHKTTSSCSLHTIAALKAVAPDVQDLPFQPTKLVYGSEHGVALARQGEAWAWGWNEHGNLGVGQPSDGITPWSPLASHIGGSRVLDAWAGNATTWLLCSEP